MSYETKFGYEATKRSRKDASLKIIYAMGLKATDDRKWAEFYKTDEEILIREGVLAQYFLQSPDHERCDFFDYLCEAGWKVIFYKADYHWKLGNGYVDVEYVEGDVYVTNPKTNEYEPMLQ